LKYLSKSELNESRIRMGMTKTKPLDSFLENPRLVLSQKKTLSFIKISIEKFNNG
jgi:hypothetical protein